MPAHSTDTPPVQPHRNHGLFSDHYLNVTLPSRQQWRELIYEARPVMEAVAGVLASFHPSDNEAQTERDLVRPVLEILGHTVEVQPPLATPGGTKRPDYVFYHDAASLNTNKGRSLNDELLRGKSFAVGDAKYWERPLDVSLKKGGDAFTNRNPSFQISFYMQHAGTEWGILTNGRLWRLYHKDTVHKLDRFYEVDLHALVTAGHVEGFLYFYAFFHRSAFEDHPLSVRAMLQESEDYARSVGNSLKTQVYEALRHVAQGFLDHPQNALEPASETLREIYDNSLIVLYRLLFVLYAESRDLLPVHESEMYRAIYSLHAIKHDVARGRRLLPTSATMWPKLRELFGIINEGSPPLRVATFNGGLFDPARHPFLERYTVGDGHLQEAIDKLSRVEEQFVDYRDLAERHLGTIYEGLLEYHLQALPEPEDGWTVALLNDKGERKASGSYYTPDFVVKYIVDQTVSPALEEAVADKKTDEEKVEAVLGLNVLDPSMGSGHFLVEATERIARFLVELGVAPEDVESDGEAELAYWKRRVVQSCVYGVELNPLAVDLAKLSLWLATVAKDRPLSFLDHHLRTGNSLVGARIDDLQRGSTRKKRKKKRDDETQLSMLEDPAFQNSMSTAVGSMWTIEGSAAETVEEVRGQERIYKRLREDLSRRYARLADLATATRFGLEVDPSLWKALIDYAAGRAPYAPPQFQRWLNEAEKIAAERRFFHWELEFPEVFFDRQGRTLGEDAGFDAIVGNPPYVQSKHFPELKPYLQAAYSETYKGAADLYVYFFQFGLSRLKDSGRMGYISSGLFSKLDYGAPLRQFLTSRSTVLEIVEFGEEQVFEGAVTYPIILSLKNEFPKKTATLGLRSITDLTNDTLPEPNPIPKADDIWAFTTKSLQHILRGWKKSRTVGEVLGNSIRSGIKTGLNDAFILDRATRNELVEEDPTSAEIIKPCVRGEDLRPWHQEDNGLYLIFSRKGIDIEAYPAIKCHLERFREKLEPKPKGWTGRDWPGRKAGAYKWHEMQDPIDYYSVFEQPRIHSTKVSLYPTFSFSEEVSYALNTSYVLPVEDTIMGNYLLGVLNSRVCEFYCRKVFAPKANGYFEIQPRELSRLPIPDASDEERGKVGKLAEEITAEARTRYTLHDRTQRRILSDLCPNDSGKKLNQKLTAWWNLDFSAFRAEIKKVFKVDIPLAERDEWEDWLMGRRAEHQRITAEIVRLETELNTCVYALFDLTPEEIQTIEESTKYSYGEV